VYSVPVLRRRLTMKFARVIHPAQRLTLSQETLVTKPLKGVFNNVTSIERRGHDKLLNTEADDGLVAKANRAEDIFERLLSILTRRRSGLGLVRKVTL
jgi:hypothetical protein